VHINGKTRSTVGVYKFVSPAMGTDDDAWFS
jgi:hypothetical protein